jgi:hypothetical protein
MPPPSAIKMPLERTMSTARIPSCASDDEEDDNSNGQEANHRNQKRMRENNMDTAGEGEGVDPNLFSPPREAKQQAVRRLEYPDADDLLGQISQIPDDNTVEEEPQMSQAWNQDQSDSSQPETSMAAEVVPVHPQQDHDHGDPELEEGEILIIESQMPIAG